MCVVDRGGVRCCLFMVSNGKWFYLKQQDHSMTDLKTEQEVNLINLLVDMFGTTLNKITFTENILQLFEDIAGFESLDDFELQLTLNKLWKIYDDKYRN